MHEITRIQDCEYQTLEQSTCFLQTLNVHQNEQLKTVLWLNLSQEAFTFMHWYTWSLTDVKLLFALIPMSFNWNSLLTSTSLFALLTTYQAACLILSLPLTFWLLLSFTLFICPNIIIVFESSRFQFPNHHDSFCQLTTCFNYWYRYICIAT